MQSYTLLWIQMKMSIQHRLHLSPFISSPTKPNDVFFLSFFRSIIYCNNSGEQQRFIRGLFYHQIDMNDRPQHLSRLTLFPANQNDTPYEISFKEYHCSNSKYQQHFINTPLNQAHHHQIHQKSHHSITCIFHLPSYLRRITMMLQRKQFHAFVQGNLIAFDIKRNPLFSPSAKPHQTVSQNLF